jgi:hypothetical protein
MKTLVLAAAVAALAVAPAMARTARHHAPAQVRTYSDPSEHSSMINGRDSVYVGGQYQGTDPDARVRLELRRDTDSIGGGA